LGLNSVSHIEMFYSSPESSRECCQITIIMSNINQIFSMFDKTVVQNILMAYIRPTTEEALEESRQRSDLTDIRDINIVDNGFSIRRQLEQLMGERILSVCSW
jgi:hypothetical protein